MQLNYGGCEADGSFPCDRGDRKLSRLALVAQKINLLLTSKVSSKLGGEKKKKKKNSPGELFYFLTRTF